MDPLVQKAIEEAVRKAVEGTVPVTWAASGIALATTVVGVLWAWGLGLSTKFAAKVEELAIASQKREDERAAKAEDQCNKRLESVEERCRRAEAARDLALGQYANVLKDAHSLTLERLALNTEVLEELSQEVSPKKGRG